MTTVIVLTALTAYLTLPQTEQEFCPAAPLSYRGAGRVKATTASCQYGIKCLGSYRASERG